MVKRVLLIAAILTAIALVSFAYSKAATSKVIVEDTRESFYITELDPQYSRVEDVAITTGMHQDEHFLIINGPGSPNWIPNRGTHGTIPHDQRLTLDVDLRMIPIILEHQNSHILVMRETPKGIVVLTAVPCSYSCVVTVVDEDIDTFTRVFVEYNPDTGNNSYIIDIGSTLEEKRI